MSYNIKDALTEFSPIALIILLPLGCWVVSKSQNGKRKYQDPRIYMKHYDEDSPEDTELIYDNDSVYVFVKKLDTVYLNKNLKNEK
jgi:hypothetical protein